ncbi:phosphonate metabolism protein/1,5-bisphosphokinase (PRPP-forming) PhnN [Jiella marina]|uniref:phosphonate metabolism protein/1,5-bisphosphokinase (PRPP-forming) PhnN n=1 Tax=Jiella sp. LLJ827 TaxID=2917712 RepID=UPI002100E0B4|nr:phosphonate metabolism protein/1,5-bisphosphokinase (PRPP-forming) PhnN [Jiella sp. LLJ827]MCQ0988091.1 phosphonate metabolism protein/1,5-bisphosphokinase (PRPP-forming) PhnN [Jiella sp. LLJ827]
MQTGTLFYVVGPSGVGKDTLISEGMKALGPSGRYVQVRRMITRPAGIGEDHQPVNDETFAAMVEDGRFLHHWQAHGLRYGLPIGILDDLKAGRNVIANGSRGAIPDLAGIVDRFVIVEITAPPAIIRERLMARGRESAEEIEQRLARTVEPLPSNLDVVTVVNDTALDEAVTRHVAALDHHASRLFLKRVPIASARRRMAYLREDNPLVDAAALAGEGRIEITHAGTGAVRAELDLVEPCDMLRPDEIGLSREVFEALGVGNGSLVSVARTPSPSSRKILRRKIAGERLRADDYETLFGDIVDGRYPDGETAAFLLKAIQSLDDEEAIAVAKARCRFGPRIDWGSPSVVDKHSLGGIPGSRITLIVVPIVAAAGLLMPKTSSRAITSASGTADVMEALCRIDLSFADVDRVVRETGGCIAWNGRLNHSVLDDVVNAITRPLALDSNTWSVASILSKKWTAGSTHVVIDMPYGPNAKLKTRAEADELGRIFERVGAGLGMTVRAFATDGGNAIGNGIGPALELRDVMKVLDNAPDAPADLRNKALFFASQILSFSPEHGSHAEARRTAEEILVSGRARAKLDEIAAAQGAHSPIMPGPFTRTIAAPRDGMVEAVDGWHIAGIARRAGAPHDKSAGVDLKVGPGHEVFKGDPLFMIHSGSVASLERAVAAATPETGITLSSSGIRPSHIPIDPREAPPAPTVT